MHDTNIGRTKRKPAHPSRLYEFRLANQLQRSADRGVETFTMPNRNNAIVLLGLVNQRLSVRNRIGQRLFNQAMNLIVQTKICNLKVGPRWSSDHNRIDFTH